MAFKLTPEAQARADQYQAWAKSSSETFEALNNAGLVASARLYMSNMTPLHWAPGEPVYDATMWHIILPELLRRLELPAKTDIDPLYCVEEYKIWKGIDPNRPVWASRGFVGSEKSMLEIMEDLSKNAPEKIFRVSIDKL